MLQTRTERCGTRQPETGRVQRDFPRHGDALGGRSWGRHITRRRHRGSAYKGYRQCAEEAGWASSQREPCRLGLRSGFYSESIVAPKRDRGKEGELGESFLHYD